MVGRAARTPTIAIVAIVSIALGAVVGTLAVRPATGVPRVGETDLGTVVFLSHLNSPRVTPGFPGDPRFFAETSFTVREDGFYLQYVHEGEHTGTHYSAPCHFHARAICAGELRPEDLVLPAVVIDVREQVAGNPDYEITVADLRAWEDAYGAMPVNAAVLALTGCDLFWGPEAARDEPTYYNCGTNGAFHQPGFSLHAVKWLIDRGVLGERGALGTDTFGPDPGTDPLFRESSMTLRRHRITLENLTNLDALPAVGAWIVVGGPRNAHGSGAPGTVMAIVPA
jgi:kynurenine formamidase